jgi:hypothetical protein
MIKLTFQEKIEKKTSNSVDHKEEYSFSCLHSQK